MGASYPSVSTTISTVTRWEGGGSQTLASSEFKSCCTRLYEEQLTQFLLGPSLHPGGLELTRRLGNTLGLSSSDVVLDMASGLGETARLLSEEYGCEVYGVDVSRELLKRAAAEVIGRPLGFARADGENLPFKNGSFTVMISECSLCLLPEIRDGLDEASRILQRRGRLGFTDIAVNGPLPAELEDVLMSFLCLSNKIPPSRYSELVEKAGFVSTQVFDVSNSLRLLLEKIRKRLFLAELMTGIGKLSLPEGQLERGKRLLSLALGALDRGSLGYFMLTAEKP